jgi:HSP20 family molecular chaperone IbpA
MYACAIKAVWISFYSTTRTEVRVAVQDLSRGSSDSHYLTIRQTKHRAMIKYFRLNPFKLAHSLSSLTQIESSVLHLNKTALSEVFHEKTYAVMKFEWDESEDCYKLLGHLFVDIDPKNICISLTSHQLILETHMSPRSEADLTKPQSLCLRKHFAIPKNVDETAISATLQDHFLQIVMPKISSEERHAMDKSVDILRV